MAKGRKTGGRQKGTPNKATKTAREMFGLSDDETERLKVLAVAEAEATVRGKHGSPNR